MASLASAVRAFSTAIVRISNAQPIAFARNGVLVGAALSAALASAPAAELHAAFIRACAASATPLAPAEAPGTLADADAALALEPRHAEAGWLLAWLVGWLIG